MVQVEFVKARFKPVYEKKERQIPTGKMKKSLFGLIKTPEVKSEVVEELKGYSDKEIDGNQLAQDLKQKISELTTEGFTIKNIIPVVSGNYYYQYSDKEVQSRPHLLGETEKVYGGGSYGFGYGYSYTEGVVIYAQKET